MIRAWPPACMSRCQQRLRHGCQRGEDSGLREVPATGQAIRAGGPSAPGRSGQAGEDEARRPRQRAMSHAQTAGQASEEWGGAL